MFSPHIFTLIPFSVLVNGVTTSIGGRMRVTRVFVCMCTCVVIAQWEVDDECF